MPYSPESLGPDFITPAMFLLGVVAIFCLGAYLYFFGVWMYRKIFK